MLLNDKVFYELFIVSFTKHLDPFKFLNFILEFTFNLKLNFSQIYLQLFHNKWNNFFQSNSGTPKAPSPDCEQKHRAPGTGTETN